MSRRMVLGYRANGDCGIFISPPGVDAFTAPDSSLVFNVTSKVSQLLLMGKTSTNGALIPLGLSRKPLVFLTTQYNFAPGTIGVPGPIRPSPPFVIGANGAVAGINGNGSSMSIFLGSTSQTGFLPCIYQVFSQAFS